MSFEEIEHTADSRCPRARPELPQAPLHPKGTRLMPLFRNPYQVEAS